MKPLKLPMPGTNLYFLYVFVACAFVLGRIYNIMGYLGSPAESSLRFSYVISVVRSRSNAKLQH